MKKPVIVVTHERSGTHLLINCINYLNRGRFYTIGYSPESKTTKEFIHETYKDIMSCAYKPATIYKSHHQVEFVEDYKDFLFAHYNVIYIKRDVKDVLCSYYNFLSRTAIINLPSLEEWVFLKPEKIGKEYLQIPTPDPHVIIEPANYIHRWKIHTEGWAKYNKNFLTLNYEDLLIDYFKEKQKIENFIGAKIANTLPDIKDLSLPNFNPGKGIVGNYKNIMNLELINKINKLY